MGLLLAQTAKVVSHAFEKALAEAGGSTPTWLILLAVKTQQVDNQRALAEAVGIRGATLTHHLDNLERRGLVRRVADPDNRRVQGVELTPAGDKLFLGLRDAAVAFDRRLRRGLGEPDELAVRRVLGQLSASVSQPPEHQPTVSPTA
jgi:MarR family transcriptional regulator, transcriptional regulator for hemolysin